MLLQVGGCKEGSETHKIEMKAHFVEANSCQ